ncbi:MAG: hypothetical protein H7A33_05865 [Deltaproteobacteria bacterium]|nr:hypothetical protein [Deltaproteobacteria bacterium]
MAIRAQEKKAWPEERARLLAEQEKAQKALEPQNILRFLEDHLEVQRVFLDETIKIALQQQISAVSQEILELTQARYRGEAEQGISKLDAMDNDLQSKRDCLQNLLEVAYLLITETELQIKDEISDRTASLQRLLDDLTKIEAQHGSHLSEDPELADMLWALKGIAENLQARLDIHNGAAEIAQRK